MSAAGLLFADVVLCGISNNCDKLQVRIAEHKDCLNVTHNFSVRTSVQTFRRHGINFHSPQLLACVQHRNASVEHHVRQHWGCWPLETGVTNGTHVRVRSCCCRWWLETDWSGIFAMPGTPSPPPCSVTTTLSLADPLVPPSVWVVNMDSQVLHSWRHRPGKPSCHTVCRERTCSDPLNSTRHALFPYCLALKAEGDGMFGPVPVPRYCARVRIRLVVSLLVSAFWHGVPFTGP